MTENDMSAAAEASEPALVAKPRWVPIAGYEGLYEVSDQGFVRRMPSRRVMSGVPDSTGYPTAKLYKDGKGTRFKIHRLVCLAFHGEGEPGQEVGHLDGSKTNAAATNLKWVTKVENAAHAKAHGTARGFTDVAGERHPRAKLTDAEVADFRARADAGESVTALAKEFGIKRPYAFALRAGSRRPVPVSALSGDGQAQKNDPPWLPVFNERWARFSAHADQQFIPRGPLLQAMDDLIVAVAQSWGRGSPEHNLIRDVDDVIRKLPFASSPSAQPGQLS